MIKLMKSVFPLTLLLVSSYSHAFSTYKNDFRDTKNSLHITYTLDGYSDVVAFNSFDKKQNNEPDYANDNNAFGEYYYDIYYNFSTYKVGLFKQQLGEANVNNGLMQTIFNVKKDFFQLLRTSTINDLLDTSAIRGDVNYYDTHGLFLQKIFQYNNHFLGVKLKLNRGNNLQHINVSGETNSEHFKESFDYYYTSRNYISKGGTESKEPSGLGYGVDIEYIYNKDKLYFYFGAFNIGAYIHWINVTFMHYDLDSQVIYKGDDGFNHARPFGTGYYKYNVSFKQKLPHYYKTSFEYAMGNSIGLGHNLNIYDDMYINEPNISYRTKFATYKLGYIYEHKEAVFELYSKYVMFQISNKLSKTNDVIRVNIKLSY